MVVSLVNNEAVVRLAVFLAVFALCAIAETARPRRQRFHSMRQRWPGNLGIGLIDALVLRVLVPGSATGVALLVEHESIGLFPSSGLSGIPVVIASVLILDLAIYIQHRVFHRVPLLWRLHRMHHSDADLDVTSGIRFHPLEVLISIAIKSVLIITFGMPVLAVLLFEIALNATSLFNHSNIRIPSRIERGLRRIVVTPDMHRVHHSTSPSEMSANFGFSLPWWDWLFGTYQAEPVDGHATMRIGLERFRGTESYRLDLLLTQPLR